MPALPATSGEQAGSEACVVAPMPASDAPMPAQEAGTRPQRAPSYRVDATLAIAGRSAVIRLVNETVRSDAPWAHFTLHVHDDTDAEPRRYDVAPGMSIEDAFAIADDGAYDIAVYGPNGLVRRFVAIVDAGDAANGIRTGGLAARVESANEKRRRRPALSRSEY